MTKCRAAFATGEIEAKHDIHGTIVLDGKIRSHATLSNIFCLVEIK